MQRAQRGVDNPALDLAIETANEWGKPVVVFLAPVPFFPGGNERHYAFLLGGLKDVAEDVEARGAAFVLRTRPHHRIDDFCREVDACLVVGDENRLRETERWRSVAAGRLDVKLVTVDADVVVPTLLSGKEEYGARTLRPRIHRRLDEFLLPSEEPQARVPCPVELRRLSEPLEPDRLLRELPLDRSVKSVHTFAPGPRQARKRLDQFIENDLAGYPALRSRPEALAGTSLLSPYLHFGHLGPRQAALRVLDSDAPDEARQAFLEQLVVRRELAVNFVHYNAQYDSFDCVHPWARATLEKHAADPRQYLYSDQDLEYGLTHDPLWNAAQNQMRLTGHMHNVLRMYWGKKILEWTEHPAIAFEIANRLNDRYELDGRDPNGYTGVAWAIGGKHDRAFGPERPIFGKIRYMSLASTGRKFNSKAYIAAIKAIARDLGDAYGLEERDGPKRRK